MNVFCPTDLYAGKRLAIYVATHDAGAEAESAEQILMPVARGERPQEQARRIVAMIAHSGVAQAVIRHAVEHADGVIDNRLPNRSPAS